jgi:hypothetical protein
LFHIAPRSSKGGQYADNAICGMQTQALREL